MTELLYVPWSEIERIRRLPVAPAPSTTLFADVCRLNALYMIARAGSGHIGTTFSCMDMVAWLFLHELRRPGDIYFSSKGHDAPALYAVLIGLGLLPFELLHRLRRLGGLPGHPDVSVPFVETNTGSLGMGISKAKGMALANRHLGRRGRIYVLTGDGEIQEGQIWESLHSASHRGLAEITVIVDHNKFQSDTWVARVNDLGDLKGKLRSFGWYVARCDGHDLTRFGEILAGLRQISDRPQIVIADTIKGRGVSFMEHTALGPDDEWYHFHSGAPDDETYAKAVAELIETVNAELRDVGADPLVLEHVPRPPRPQPARSQRLIRAYSEALVREAERNSRIVALDADLVLDCGLIPFRERFPDRFVECGIAEQDMVSQAGGMALRGLLPVVHSFACFLSSRPNEQIYNNATEKTRIVYVGSLAGLLPGGPGHSHQCVRDISALAAVPGLILLEPCNEAEVAQAVGFCLNRTTESTYLRLVSIPCDVPYELPAGYELEPGRGAMLRDGADAVLFGYGPVLLTEAYRAAEILSRRHGVEVRIVNLPWLNRIDLAWLRDAVAGIPWVFTLDNHYVVGGQGDMLLRALCEADSLGGRLRTRRFGVREIPVCGQNDEVLRAHGLDADSLCAQIAAAVAGDEP